MPWIDRQQCAGGSQENQNPGWRGGSLFLDLSEGALSKGLKPGSPFPGKKESRARCARWHTQVRCPIPAILGAGNGEIPVICPNRGEMLWNLRECVGKRFTKITD